MLFESSRHEALCSSVWNEYAVQQATLSIIDDIETSLLPDACWPTHPLDAEKGSNICHGTAGNGYAFLYLYHRWGNKVWLDRARKFAMHAIKQYQNDRLAYGQGRYTLWTGDAGLAIYLHHCLYPQQAAIPGLDLF
ncbi:lanthionine synthetase LanC family protein [Lacimicrobium alkaliphilum]|uniref:Uncharacterized protein n=1 Tax=Lacimicrobium alkaliphilum TaxID=1526571 RepID=A0ABQ1RDQ6_9ALTE|nr:lanthionine synthetase LanC family protein [Lacimicrobium alkaliphilum]GGD63240.1 hypothetical protein GCM10011357_18140 [Lacimicrobium alkaliphilum]